MNSYAAGGKYNEPFEFCKFISLHSYLERQSPIIEDTEIVRFKEIAKFLGKASEDRPVIC